MDNCAIQDLDTKKHVCMATLIRELNEMENCYGELLNLIQNKQYNSISNLLDRKTSTGNNCIPNLPEKIIILLDNTNVTIDLLAINRGYFIQKKDNSGNLFYFKYDPLHTLFNENKITNQFSKYPVYYYQLKNRLVIDYNLVKNKSPFCVTSVINTFNSTGILNPNMYIINQADDITYYDIRTRSENMVNHIREYLTDMTNKKKLISEHYGN